MQHNSHRWSDQKTYTKINWFEMLKLNFSFDYLVFIDFNLVFTHRMLAIQVNDLGQTLKTLKKTFWTMIFVFYLNPNRRDMNTHTVYVSKNHINYISTSEERMLHGITKISHAFMNFWMQQNSISHLWSGIRWCYNV